MLDDFHGSSIPGDTRVRLVASTVLASVLYAGFGIAMVAATRAVHPPIEVDLKQVSLPRRDKLKPPSPPVPIKAPTRAREKRPLRPLPTPRELATVVGPESDTQLPDDGDTDPGAQGGLAIAAANQARAAAPDSPRLPPPLLRPRDLPGNRYTDLKYPPLAMRRGIAGAIVVEFDVMEDGHVANARIVSGPVEFHETVLDAARSWTFEPARQAGKAVRYRLTKRIVFRFDD